MPPRVPSDPDAREWEIACVAAVRAALISDKRLWGSGELEGIDLEGQAPDTPLIVRWADRLDGRKKSRSYRLWGPQAMADDGRRREPGSIGSAIELNLAEFP